MSTPLPYWIQLLQALGTPAIGALAAVIAIAQWRIAKQNKGLIPPMPKQKRSPPQLEPVTYDDSKEKCNVGDLWEQKSDGKALFFMTVIEKDKPSLFDQIAVKIG
jgi:hypothetical protein